MESTYPITPDQPLDRRLWLKRECTIFANLRHLGLDIPTTDSSLESAWSMSTNIGHRFIPPDLDHTSLLKACRRTSVALGNNATEVADIDGESLPTQRGIIYCNFNLLMIPTDDRQRPFECTKEQQIVWGQELGASSIVSVETCLYLILRALLELKRIPIMGGWIRCANQATPGFSLGVSYTHDYQLAVALINDNIGRWCIGAIPYWFRPIDS